MGFHELALGEPFYSDVRLEISYVNCIVMLVAPVMAGFIQVNKPVKSLIRYHTKMLKKEITIIKFHQVDVIEIRK